MRIALFRFLIYNVIIDISGHLLANWQYPLKSMNPDGIFTVEKKEERTAYITGQGTVIVLTKGTKEVIVIPDMMRDRSQKIMATSPDVGKFYVIEDAAVLVTDVNTEKVIKTVTFGMGKQRLTGIMVIPGKTQVYVAIGDGNIVSVIDTVTDEVKTTIPVGQHPCSMAATLDGAFVYVRNYISKEVSVINTKTNQVIDTIPVEEKIDPEFAKTMAAAEEEDTMKYRQLSETTSFGEIISFGGITSSSGTTPHSGTTPLVSGMITEFEEQTERSEEKYGQFDRKTSLGKDHHLDGAIPLERVTSFGKATALEGTITESEVQIEQFKGNKEIKKKLAIAVVVALVIIVIVVAVAVPLTKHTSSIPSLQRVSVAYVTNAGSEIPYGQSVSVIDTERGIVMSTIQVGLRPVAVVFTPDGTQAYVANQADETVSVIDTATDQVVSTISVNSDPAIIVFTPDGAQAYVVNGNSSTVFVINRGTGQVIAIPVGEFSNDIAITPDGTKAYVTNGDVNTVSVIDTAVNQVITTISVGKLPAKVSITLDGTKAYVANQADNTVSVIDTDNNQVIANISVGIAPTDIAMNPNGTQAYVVNSGIGNLDSSISIIDTITNQMIYEITFGYASPFKITISSDSTKAYAISSVANGYFYYIDLEANTYLAIFDQGNAVAIALTPDGTRACVVNHGSNSVTLLNTTSNTEIVTISTGDSGPVGVATAVIDHR
jgi:YVTN family beta-propeller protein